MERREGGGCQKRRRPVCSPSLTPHAIFSFSVYGRGPALGGHNPHHHRLHGTAKSLESPAWSFEATAAMFVLVGQSSSLAYKGFLPANRGKVIGVLDGAFGLSPALFSAIYALHFSPRVGSFFLLVAGCLFGVSLLGQQPYTHLQPATPVHVTAVHWMDAAVDWREALARAKWRLRAFATPCVVPPFGASLPSLRS